MLFSPLFKSTLSVSLSIKTWSLGVLLFSEFINVYTFYICIDSIMLLYTFLVISVDWYNE